MKRVRIGPLEVTVAGGADREGGGDGPAVVLCHGFGAPGDDLVSLCRQVDAGRDVRWFFPEAPLDLTAELGFPGRAWWPIDMVRLQERMMRGQLRDLAAETPPGMAEARAALEACLGELEARHGMRRSELVLGGFSQGAMLATEIALHAAEPPSGLCVISGSLVSEDRWRAAAATNGPRLRVLMSHGRRDPILPFVGAEALRDLLVAAGAKVEWIAHGGQHEIPWQVLERLGAFLRGT